MKTALDPRHVKREITIKSLFAESFLAQPTKDTRTREILAHQVEIDRIIGIIAPEFPVDKINKIDLAILRLAVYELLLEKDQAPEKVIIDEAIELAKDYGGDHSPAFINGALGKLIKERANGLKIEKGNSSTNSENI